MRLVTYNIHYGVGRDGHHDLDRIAAAVDGADVIALQEVERYWPRSGMVDQVRELAKRLPEYWWVYGATIDLHSDAGFPGEASDRRRQFGNLLMSRTPILGSRHLHLPRAPGAPVSMGRGAIEGVIRTARHEVRVASTHLCYLSTETRLVQLEALAHANADAAAGNAPWIGRHPGDGGWTTGDEPPMPPESIVLGDLNFGPGAPEYARLATSTAAPYVDAWTRVRDGAEGASKDGERIDHCWVTPALAESVRWAWVDEAADGSDHQPVWFHFDL
jgi:endonuclease/exonuclease/phosphatase family metal-dependent hydrolase